MNNARILVDEFILNIILVFSGMLSALIVNIADFFPKKLDHANYLHV